MSTDAAPACYVIGGGPLGMRTLRVAKDLGLRLIVTDKDPDAPGFGLADESYVIDGGDVEGHLEIAQTTSQNVVAVLCGAEFGAPAVNALREHLGLEFNDPDAVRRVLDKEELKLAFLQEGVPTPIGAVAETADQLLELMQSAERVVVKPLSGSGSRGVRVIQQGANVRAVFEAALAAVPGERAVLVEPFVNGRSIDANGILTGGELLPAGLLEKFSTPLPSRLPVGGYDPADLSPEQVLQAYDLLAEAASAVGLWDGPVKADLLLGDDGFQILEVAPRFHGDVTTAGTLPHGSRIDPVRAYLQRCMTGSHDQSLLEPKESAHAAWRVLALPPGTVQELPGEGLVEEHPDIELVWHRVAVGDVIPPYEDTRHIPGYVTAKGATPAAVEAALASWFAAASYVVSPDAQHTEWYAGLVKELHAIGLDPAGCGVPEQFR